jgi:cytoskeletal protein RodZ
MNTIVNSSKASVRFLKMWFFIVAAILLAVAVTWVSQLKQRVILEKTLKELTLAESGLKRIREASANHRKVLAAIQSQFDQNTGKKSQEMILYEKVDEMKTALKPDNLTISRIEKKGGEASLQFTLTFNNLDYPALLNIAGSLHAAVFPLTQVNSIDIKQSDSKTTRGVSFKITGKIITIGKSKP